jgi:hypothetical protein
VGEVADRYAKSVQPMKSFIARVQKQPPSAEELRKGKVKLSDGTEVSLKEADHDHPLMKDIVRQAIEEAKDRKAFYEVG